ncbi:hypothetical protein ACOMD4_11630 [Streptomyces anulatus]|uniref:hypothetical protein n=1 Tax=Streptomyces anulatus TaxID=1892 RepID=UPI003B7B5D93
MDIPNWLLWPALGAWLLQALALVPGIRRLRGPDPAVRIKARLDSAGCLLVITGLLPPLDSKADAAARALRADAVPGGADDVLANLSPGSAKGAGEFPLL